MQQTDSNTSVTSTVSETSNQKSTNNSREKFSGWAGVHCSFMQTDNMKNLILLDSNFTDTVFCNEKYVTNIRDSVEVLEIKTNGCSIKLKKLCDVLHLGTHWFNEESITNIISLAHMINKYRVMLDS